MVIHYWTCLDTDLLYKVIQSCIVLLYLVTMNDLLCPINVSRQLCSVMVALVWGQIGDNIYTLYKDVVFIIIWLFTATWSNSFQQMSLFWLTMSNHWPPSSPDVSMKPCVVLLSVDCYQISFEKVLNIYKDMNVKKNKTENKIKHNMFPIL